MGFINVSGFCAICYKSNYCIHYMIVISLNRDNNEIYGKDRP